MASDHPTAECYTQYPSVIIRWTRLTWQRQIISWLVRLPDAGCLFLIAALFAPPLSRAHRNMIRHRRMVHIWGKAFLAGEELAPHVVTADRSLWAGKYPLHEGVEERQQMLTNHIDRTLGCLKF